MVGECITYWNGENEYRILEGSPEEKGAQVHLCVIDILLDFKQVSCDDMARNSSYLVHRLSLMCVVK